MYDIWYVIYVKHYVMKATHGYISSPNITNISFFWSNPQWTLQAFQSDMILQMFAMVIWSIKTLFIADSSHFFNVFAIFHRDFPRSLEKHVCGCHGFGTVPGLLPILGLLPFLPASSAPGQADAHPGQQRTCKMSHCGASDGLATVQRAEAFICIKGCWLWLSFSKKQPPRS